MNSSPRDDSNDQKHWKKPAQNHSFLKVLFRFPGIDHTEKNPYPCRQNQQKIIRPKPVDPLFTKEIEGKSNQKQRKNDHKPDRQNQRKDEKYLVKNHTSSSSKSSRLINQIRPEIRNLSFLNLICPAIESSLAHLPKISAEFEILKHSFRLARFEQIFRKTHVRPKTAELRRAGSP